MSSIDYRFKVGIFCLFAFCSLTLLLSCGGSEDDTDTNGGNGAPKSMRISKIVEETQGTIRERLFTYDTNGRIVTMITKVNSASGNSEYKRTYQYGETLIIEKTEINQQVSSLDAGPHTYTLKDGRIVLDGETKSGLTKYVAFTYDQEGRMESFSDYFADANDEPSLHYLTWKEGNLMEIDYRWGLLAPYIYTNMVWATGLIVDVSKDIVPCTDPILLATGFYGKLPKNLPSKYDNVSYEYTTSGGHVTKIKKVTEDITGYYPSETCTINITWE